MSYRLDFAELVHYDSGQPGITLPVTLGFGQTMVRCEAKLDTGSSVCIFARDVGEELGLDIDSGLRLTIGTVTGNFVVYMHEIDLSVAGFGFNALVGFAEASHFSRNVLGRRGFIERVIVGLVDYQGDLYLGRYGDM
jgi:hypothetical protein